jgi:hypothetical protein
MINVSESGKMVVSGISLGIGVDIPKSEAMGFELRIPGSGSPGEKNSLGLNTNNGDQSHVSHVQTLTTASVSVAMPVRAPSSDDSLCSEDGHVVLSPHTGSQHGRFYSLEDPLDDLLPIFLPSLQINIITFVQQASMAA